MKITNLTINNFRGIKSTSIIFPLDSRIICLIGSGDSGKSTLLSAIEWVLCPTWNLSVTDTDFYNCDPSNPIEINASIAEIPEALIKEDKFGLYLRDYDKVISGNNDDEPSDTGKTIITVSLTIDETLEPKWNIITNRTEPKPISQKDRRMLSFGIVGFDYEKDFLWGRNSILQKYADSKDVLHNAFTQAMRSAVENTNLDILDKKISSLNEIGQKYGVSFNGDIHNRLLMQNGLYSTTVGIFDDKVPFSQRGLGSKRLLSIGMNINAFENDSLVLIDEIETGLEPYRISSLINQFRNQFKNSGQLIMTTLSMSVLCECCVNEIGICTNNGGIFSLHSFYSELDIKDDVKDDIQAILRCFPEAFLCKRVIVCEGKTEVGILRSYDKYITSKGMPRLSHYGVGVVQGGGGDRFFKLAKILHKCGYDVSIVMDSDIEKEESIKKEMETINIPIFDWEKGLAIEEQIFKDVSIECINEILAFVIKEKSLEHVKEKLKTNFNNNLPYKIEDETISVLEDIDEKDRIMIGTIAKKKGSEWFKTISKGECIGNIIFSQFDALPLSCHLRKQLNELQNWIEKK